MIDRKTITLTDEEIRRIVGGAQEFIGNQTPTSEPPAPAEDDDEPLVKPRPRRNS